MRYPGTIADLTKHYEIILSIMNGDKKQNAWYAMDNPKGYKKIVHAGDAYFCCHEFKEDG
jgi:hypothetical protein